jgi:dipeptidyl aminopeptidase/acylaminoacyl peptidase
VRTVIRWEQEGGLPVHRVPVGQRQAVFAYPREIDEWLKRGSNGNGDHLASVIAEEIQTVAMPAPAKDLAQPGRIWLRKSPSWLRWTIAMVGVVAAGAFALHSLTAPRQIQFTGIAQVTSDGTSKVGLVAGGGHLYFGEKRDGKVVLSEVSVSGGPVRSIPTPFINATPEDISPDGKELLVLDREGQEEERALWIVPIAGGEPRPAGNIFCHSAAWSPDGERIAYATGSGIYLTSSNGVGAQQIQNVSGVPGFLRWSLDGQRLRYNLLDENTGRSSLQELTFASHGGSQVSSPIPLFVSFSRGLAALNMSDHEGRSFLSIESPIDNKIWFLEKSWGLFGSHFVPVELGGHFAGITALGLDRNARTLFVLSGATGDTELLRFNPATREFTPFLPGIQARFVDFSRDGRQIAYVGLQDKSLWISRADGSQRRQVDFQATETELPRWSPDGRQIAFMAKLPDKPWRIYIVQAEGGTPKEASTGTDNQGAPTWSPDGRWLMYGNVKCEQLGTCAIHKIDLSTGQEYTLPGSEGMGTARWSPDGRSVAALYRERREVYVLDLATARWRKLAEGINGNDLSWSADSRTIYSSRPSGDKPEILRISLSDGKVVSAVDLSTFDKLAGNVDTWFGLAPDGSIIFMRLIDKTEIYALHYEEK